MNAVLGEGDHIHVAFNHQQLVQLPDGLFGLEKPVNLAALVKHIRLRGVDVFRLVVAQGAAAECHGSAPAIANREHHPVAEQVPGFAVLVGNRAGFNQRTLQVLAGNIKQRRAGGGRIAHLVLLDDGVIQTPLLQVVPCVGTLLTFER